MKKRILSTSRLTRNYQVTLSRTIRDKLDVDRGDLVVFLEEDGIIIVEKG